ncbi:hypothetical protein ACS0TY_005991 [Phlomoides rotata]
MNRRLNLDIPPNNTFLLPRDILAAADHLIGLKFGMGTLDDMNHLKNKRIRSVADLLQDQFGLSLVRLENVVRGTICGAIRHKLIPTPQNLVTSTPLTTTYESFFGLHPLSQVLDRTNPLTQIVHGRKLSYLGPGGLTGRTASFRIRDIHPSHYGRICPIDTSEGINVGLIGSLAIHARMGYWGSLESPFYKISERSTGLRLLYLSPGRDEYYMLAVGNSLALNQDIQEEQVVPARYRQEFLTIAWERVHLRSIFPFQYFSIGASLIPFIEHNDANRALMSSNMQRQAVPLSRSEKCIVGTGLERQAALDSGALAIAERGGKIIYIDTDKILFSGNGDTLSISLVMYQRSNKNTCMHQKTRVQRGKYIKKGQILADGAATVGGELALGKNVLVAYMPWEGYNSEDAVLISERLVYEDIYTSFHIRKYEIQTHATSQGPERITNEIPHLEARLLRNLDKNGIVMLGSWVETGDILVGKLTPQMVKESSYAPEDRLLRAILGIQVSTSKETCLKLPIGGKGRVIDVRWIQKRGGSSYNPEMIRVYISQKREIKVGDKVAGRHGNKGIISKNLPRQDMPYLQDGRPVDMVFNPLGVPSRMNVGQIFECSLGLAGGLLDRHYRIAPFDERYEQEASRKLVFSELYEASKQTANPWVFEPEYPGKSRIFDGRAGSPFEQPVIIGKPYILKLIHQVDDKIHGRSSGHYALVTQQPLRGRAKQGGQRVGEMEVWALEGFGVAHILQEMLTYKSDHIRARQEVLDGTAMKRLISRLIDHFGMAYTSHILDQVKTLGFQQATATSISLGIDDLLTIPSKRWLVQDAEQQSFILEKHHHYGNVHAVEKLRQSIEIWYATSEYLRQEMNPNFRMTGPLNPVHIMSFSGARGNASQVHQLVGMRGLMSDPQGQMIDLPIQSNLREGLSLIEYIISCYGARKGVVDTAVRTSDAGYLTRRLVEVVQHIAVRRIDCGTARGISVSPQNGVHLGSLDYVMAGVLLMATWLNWEKL